MKRKRILKSKKGRRNSLKIILRYLNISTRKKSRKKSTIVKILNFWRSPIIIKTFIFCFFIFTVFETLFYLVIFKDLPNPHILTSSPQAATTIIRDRNGIILYKIYKDTNRTQLDWNQIPQNVKDATISIEDADFYTHHGVSIKSIVRAFLYNLNQKHISLYQGGSTLTQQLIKNRIVGADKTYIRKIKEIAMSIWAETQFSKEEILTMYLNEVGYGSTAYGIQAASQMYFGIDAGNLSLAQAAFLAGLPAAPTTFSPFGRYPELSDNRQQQVLSRMLKLGVISQSDYDEARTQKLVFAPQKTDIQAPHFVMYVKDQLVSKLGEDIVTRGGLDVTTTLDLRIQQMAEEAVKKQISEIKDIYNIHNAASLITSPATGEILAMIGSVNYFDVNNKGFVNVTTSKRQPGSSIKPVNYAYAFDRAGLTPGSTIEDAPVTYVADGTTEKYSPVNYDGKFHGTVTLRSALANSYNVPAVKILNSYGVDKMVQEGISMGIYSWIEKPDAGLSITLGGAEVTMLDMSRAYQTIANLGQKKELKYIKEIADNSGRDISSLLNEQNKNLTLVGSVVAKEGDQVISPIAAYWLTDILSDNNARLPAFGPYAKLTVPNHKIAVKTGTSNNFRDNWTIGFTPSYLTTVWVGNNDGSFMNKNLVSGITGAAPIWNEIMTNLLKDKLSEDFPVPSGLIPVRICAVNGLLTCPNCPSEKTEYFTVDKIPTRQCYFRPPAECDEAKKQAEGKSDEEKKQIMAGCPVPK